MERAMDRDINTPEIGDELRREAAVWFERIHSDDVSTEELAEWQRWVATSPAHQRAFKDLEDFWRIAEKLEEPAWPTSFELDVDTYDASTPIEAWRQRPRPQARRDRRYLHWPALAAAFVGAAACVAAYLFVFRGFGGSTEVAVFQTASREHREVVLKDGSQLLLGAKTSISINFSDEARNVVVDSGEAYFDVAKDKARPFIVRAGTGTITATGTAFNVEYVEGRVDVIVSEGSVEVLDINLPASSDSAGQEGAGPMAPAPQPTRVEAGQRFVYGATTVSEVKAVDTARVLAARKGRLEYLGEPLKFVVADVGRYTDRQLVITDPAIEEMLYTGVFLESEADDWLASLPDTYPQVEVVRLGDKRVVLQLRALPAGAPHVE